MTEKLKPCPFCGNTKIRDDQYIRDGRQVKCRGCGASTQAYNPSANEKATHLWNNRADMHTELVEALRPLVSSHHIDDKCQCNKCIGRRVLIKATKEG